MALKKDTVVLENYNPEWKEMYKEEETRLKDLLGNNIIDVMHVGSTSIEGLSAKPVIDIMVTVNKLSDVENFKDLFKLEVLSKELEKVQAEKTELDQAETEEDFQILLDWLKEAQLDRVGCFTYSPVEGATANDLPDHVPEEIKQERYERFMEVQQEISAAKLQKRIGQTMTVLVDSLEEEFPVAVARSYADAPEIDGNVFVEDIDKSVIKAGDLLEVEITDADEYDLFARLIQVKSA